MPSLRRTTFLCALLRGMEWHGVARSSYDAITIIIAIIIVVAYDDGGDDVAVLHGSGGRHGRVKREFVAIY